MIDTYHKYIFFFSTLNATPKFKHINCAAFFHQKYVFFGGGAISTLESISPMVALGYRHKYGGVHGLVIINTPIQLQLEIAVGKTLFASLGLELKDKKINFYCNASIRIPANKTIDIAASCAALIYTHPPKNTHLPANTSIHDTYVSDSSSASSSVCFEPQQNNDKQVLNRCGAIFVDPKKQVENKKVELKKISIKEKIRLENFIYKFHIDLLELSEESIEKIFTTICKKKIENSDISLIQRYIKNFSASVLKEIEHEKYVPQIQKITIPRKLHAVNFDTTLLHNSYAKDSAIMSFPSIESAEDKDRNPDLRKSKNDKTKNQNDNRINRQFNKFLKLKKIALNYVEAIVYVYADKEHAMCVFEKKGLKPEVFDSNHLTINGLCQDLNIQTGENCCFFALFLAILIKTFQNPKTAVQIVITLNNLYNLKIDRSSCVDEYVHLLFQNTHNIHEVLQKRRDFKGVIESAQQLLHQNSAMFRNWKCFGDLLRIHFVATHKEFAEFHALNTTLTENKSNQELKATIPNCLQKGFLIYAVGHILSQPYVHEKLFKETKDNAGSAAFETFLRLINDMCILQDAIQRKDLRKSSEYYSKIFESETSNYDQLFQNILNNPTPHKFYSLGDCLLFACYDAFKKCHYPKLFSSSEEVLDRLTSIFAKNGIQGNFVHYDTKNDTYRLVEITNTKTKRTPVCSHLFKIYDIPERLLLHIVHLGFTANEANKLLQYLFLNVWDQKVQSILLDCSSQINKLNSNKKSTDQNLKNELREINKKINKNENEKLIYFSHSQRLILWLIFNYKIDSFSLKNLKNPTFLLAQYLNQLVHKNALKGQNIQEKLSAIKQFLKTQSNEADNVKLLSGIHNQLDIDDPAFSYSYTSSKFILMRYHKYYQKSEDVLTLIPVTEEQKDILDPTLKAINMDFLLITNNSPISISHYKHKEKTYTEINLKNQFKSNNVHLNDNQEIIFNLFIMIINAQYKDLKKSLEYFIQVINEIENNAFQEILKAIIYQKDTDRQGFLQLKSSKNLNKGINLNKVCGIILHALKKAEIINNEV